MSKPEPLDARTLRVMVLRLRRRAINIGKERAAAALSSETVALSGVHQLRIVDTQNLANALLREARTIERKASK